MNNEISTWKTKNQADLIAQIKKLGIKHTNFSPSPQPLTSAVKSKQSYRNGMINKIGIRMPKSAIFLHKGVGKGRPATAPKGAKEWFNPVVEKNIDELGDIVANGQGNLIIKSLNIK